MTIKEYMAIHGLKSRANVRRLIKTGRIPAEKQIVNGRTEWDIHTAEKPPAEKTGPKPKSAE